MTDRGQLDVIDIISVASFLLGYENLIENRSQSEQNDVGSANDKQTSYLLEKIGERLDRQDETLERLTSMIERLERRLIENDKL